MNKIILETDNNNILIKISNIDNKILNNPNLNDIKTESNIQFKIFYIIEYINNVSKEDIINKKPNEILNSLNIEQKRLYLSLIKELIYEKFNIKAKIKKINNKTVRVFSDK